MIPNAPRCDLGMETVLQLSNMGCVLRKVFWIHFHSQKYMSPTPFLIGLLYLFFLVPFWTNGFDVFFSRFMFGGFLQVSPSFKGITLSNYTFWLKWKTGAEPQFGVISRTALVTAAILTFAGTLFLCILCIILIVYKTIIPSLDTWK